MIRSMTGYGLAERRNGGYKIQLELKSVNHRYSEIMVRMPRDWLRFEDMLKKGVQQQIKRGRVDIFVTIEREADSVKTVEVNWDLARGYMDAANQLRERFGMEDTISLKDLLSLPDLIILQDEDPNAASVIEAGLQECLNDALAQLIRMREAEGEHLARDLQQKLEVMKALHADVARIAPSTVDEYRTKLKQRMEELLTDKSVDETRIAMEVAIFAERVTIDEELTRLESHFHQFGQLLSSREPIGRKLDFMIQEMNREVNTIGSKGNHAELTGKVVDMKAELEKMREQIQNIE